MAYELTYQGEFTNRRTNNMRLEIYRKDVVPDSVVTLSNKEIISVSVGYPQGDESKYNLIISAEANITLRVRISSTITPETFLTDYYDEWKVLIYCDTMPIFAGFIEPSEGNYLMKDAPLQIDIKCTDGLGLLKNVELSDVNDASFLNTVPALIQVIAGCLNKTNLDLPIRIFCSIYESSMDDRLVDAAADMFQQAKTDYRTFLKNATDFVDCFRALEILLTGGFCIYQWFGRWVISYRPEMQGTIGPTNYYTDYDKDGAVVSGDQDFGTQILIGTEQVQHPINLDQIISYQVPVASVKSKFTYTVWDEIPKNNKFERGTLIPGISGNVFELDDNGDDTTTQIGTYSGYTIDDWTFGSLNVGPTAIANLPALAAAVDSYYKKLSVNIYGDEINREVVINKSTTVTQVLQSDGIPVNAGDRLRIGFDFKLSFQFNDQLNIAAVQVYIVPVGGGTKWWWRDGAGIANKWRLNAAAAEAIFVNYVDSDDKTKLYKSTSLESRPIPVDGTLYIQLCNVMDDSTPNSTIFRNFSFEYLPFVAGGYLQAKGDFWLTSQNQNIKDAIDEEVFLSDSIKKILKGALLRENGTTLTTPTWYRFGYLETLHYKELLNLGKFRHYYRRYRKIQGTFRGVKSTSGNALGDFYPIGFHKHYEFIDNNVSKLYVLSPPTTIDYVAGTFNTTAIEAFDSSMTEEGGITVEQVLQRLIFLINNTTEAEWNSASGAPPSGTPYFPPFAAVYPAALNTLVIRMDAGNNVTVAASDGGASNSPSLTITSNTTSFIGYRNVRIQVGADVQVGNIFTITIYGHDVTYVANTPLRFIDAEKNGDTHRFGYIF